MFIPLLVTKVFHIFKKPENLKNVKRVYPKRKIKGVKIIKMVKKVKENEPQQKERPRKVCKPKCHYFLLLCNKNLRATC